MRALHLAVGVGAVGHIGHVADMDVRHVLLLDIDIDAQPAHVGDRQHRLVAGLIGHRTLHQRADIDEARGHRAVERRAQHFVGLHHRKLCHVRLRHAVCGVCLIRGLHRRPAAFHEVAFPLGVLALVRRDRSPPRRIADRSPPIPLRPPPARPSRDRRDPPRSTSDIAARPCRTASPSGTDAYRRAA